MGLWRFECRKLWKNKLICGLILGCLFLNVLFLYRKTKSYDVERMCFPDTIKEVYEELELIPEQEKIEWLNQELGGIEQMEASYVLGYAEAMDEAVYERRNALRNVLEHAERVDQYEEYLEGIEEQAKLISSSSLFADKDLFSKRNAELIPEKYRHLRGMRLKIENSQGVLLATESGMTDVFLIFLIILLAYFCICMEREEGTMAFARCTRYGARKLGITKIIMVFTGSLFGALLLYGSNFVAAWGIYGFGDMGRWVQSVEGYIASPWKISLGGYLIFFLLGKLTATAVAAGMVILAALWGKSTLRTSIALLGAAAVEYGLYTALPPHSWLDLLRQCNLFYFMETGSFFKSYETMNLFAYPVPSALFCVVIGIITTALTLALGIVSYERVSRGEYARKSRKRRLVLRKKRLRGHSWIYYEGYKIFWTGGAGILVVAFLLIQFAVYSNEKVHFTLDELYYKNYIQYLQGEMTDGKRSFIKEEGERIQEMEEELGGLRAKADDVDGAERQERAFALERQLLCRTAYSQIQAQAKRIGAGGFFLDEVGYGYLLDGKQQVHQIGKILLLLILSFYSAFIVEETARMPVIWNTFPDGKKKIQAGKWMLLTVCIVALCAASDVMLAAYRMQQQSLVFSGVQIQYLPGFENWRHLTVLGYLILLCFFKVLLGLVICGTIAAISKKAKNATTVLLASGSVAGAFYLLMNFVL